MEKDYVINNNNNILMTASTEAVDLTNNFRIFQKNPGYYKRKIFYTKTFCHIES